MKKTLFLIFLLLGFSVFCFAEDTATETYTDTETATATETYTDTETATDTETYTATPTITRTITQTATATVTRTITQTATATITATVTRTITQTATATITATVTPTITQTPVTFETRAGRAMRLLDKAAGFQQIFKGPCYFAAYQNDSRGNTGTIAVYDATSAADAGPATYRFTIYPGATSNFIIYSTNRDILGGYIAQKFNAGVLISRTAENIEGAVYIYKP